MPTPSLTRLRKPIVVAICLAVAALHLATGPAYRGPFRPFVTGYLIDLLLPFSLVLLLGVEPVLHPSVRRPTVRATAVFLLGVGIESAQGLGVPLFGRTFDLFDLVAYAVGAAAAVVFERVLFGRATQAPP